MLFATHKIMMSKEMTANCLSGHLSSLKNQMDMPDKPLHFRFSVMEFLFRFLCKLFIDNSRKQLQNCTVRSSVCVNLYEHTCP